MTAKWLSISKKYPFSPDSLNDYIKAVCYLTNESIYDAPLRYDEYAYYRAVIYEERKKDEERREKHAEAVRNGRRRSAESYNANTSSQNSNASSSFDISPGLSKYSPQ